MLYMFADGKSYRITDGVERHSVESLSYALAADAVMLAPTTTTTTTITFKRNPNADAGK